jgi:hypothetical protein
MSISTSIHIGTKPKMRKTTMYLKLVEKRAVIKEINLTALYLLEYYLSVIARENYVMDDQKTANATGLSLRSVQDNRRKLERCNLFWVSKTKGNGMTHYLYCARKEGVYCKKYFGKLFNCNTVRDVYRNFTRKQVTDILVKHKLNDMEIKDINELL